MCVSRTMVLLLHVLVFAWAPQAQADLGRTEINQICALQGGCLSGDSPGFPVEISQPGSYVLTSSLAVVASGTSAIFVSADDVSIDLNGFSVSGPGSGGSANGIAAAFVGNEAIRIRVVDGQVRGFGGYGVQLWKEGHVERLSISENGSGVFLGDGSILLESRISSNQSGGAVLTPAVVYGRNVFTQNALSGSGASVSGGRGVDGNHCDDRRCSVRGGRLYYLTSATTTAAGAPASCAAGFHFASLTEMLYEGHLEYADGFGRSIDEGGVVAGAGGGDQGWVRAGFEGSTASNCSNWTAAGSQTGPTLTTSDASVVTTTNRGAWNLGAGTCSFPRRVWCIQD